MDVSLLGHAQELGVAILGLRVGREERLNTSLFRELHENATLERLFVVAPHPNLVGRAIELEKVLECVLRDVIRESFLRTINIQVTKKRSEHTA